MNRIAKKLAAILTSLTMVSGMFLGMELDVKAGNSYEITDPSTYQNVTVYYGDEITLYFVDRDCSLNIYYQIKLNDSTTVCIATDQYTVNHTASYESRVYPISSVAYGGNTYNKYTLTYKAATAVTDNTYNVWLTAEVLPSQTPSGTIASSHDCDFQWATSVDPQCGTDGLEVYKCTKCGAVQESHAIPAGIAYVKDFYGKIKEAPANGTVTYDFGKLATISDYLLAKMAERNDIAVTIVFEYKGTRHQLTFPAGTDYTSVLTDTDNMYGFYGIAARLGLTVTDITG